MNLDQVDFSALSEEARRAFEAARGRLVDGDARTALSHALELAQRAPGFAPAWHLAGLAALHAGELPLAVEALGRASRLAPGDADLASNLAAAYLRAARFAEAEAEGRRAHALAPSKAGPLLNWSTALRALGRLDEAVSTAENALALEPERAEAWNNLGNLYKEQGRIQEALDAYDHALSIDRNLREAFSNRLATLKLVPQETPRTLLAAHRAYALRYESGALMAYQPSERAANLTRRLRVGYVSPDCHGAVPAFLRPVLRNHDPMVCEVFCYFNNPQPPEADPEIAARMKPRVMRGWSDAQVAARVRDDEIDVLVDIAGHTGNNRLGVFMLRPAPIQMTWLDYLGTTGLASVDYRITDAVADPLEWAQEGHSETLLRLPHTQWCWEPPAEAPAVALPPASTGEAFTFGSFNNYSKITEATLALWAKLLAACPDARLLVVGASEGQAQARVARALGVQPTRLAFAPRVSARVYRELFGRVDVALDPLFFSGATTTLDALWQGVPVITLPGLTSASRSSASLLNCLGLTDFVAKDEADYLAIACRVVVERARLDELRDGLRQSMTQSPLLDAAAFTRDLETLYKAAWQAWCNATPHAFSLRKPMPPPAIPATRWRQADLALRATRAKLSAGQLEAAIAEFGELLAVHQNWGLALRDYASAVLAWAQANQECLSLVDTPTPNPSHPELTSIIVCSIDERKLAAVEASYHEKFSGYAHEFIAIRDAKSLCEGYNRGAVQARGEFLIFSHDDILLMTPDFAPRLLDHLSKWDGVGVCGTRRLISAHWGDAGKPHTQGHVIHQVAGGRECSLFVAGCAERVNSAIQAMDGVFLAARRELWECIRFDEVTFDGFHLYDLDFSYRAFLAGFRLAVPLDLTLLHRSIGSYGRDWWKSAQRFERKFEGSFGDAPEAVPGNLHCLVESIAQTRLLLAGLLHFGYGRGTEAS